MKIASLTATISRKGGGMLDCVRRLSQELGAKDDTCVDIVSVRDEFSEQDLPLWKPLPVHLFPPKGPPSFRYAPGLISRMQSLDVDIVHNHGLWTFLSIATHRWAGRKRRPYVISPQGMLDSWALKNSGPKKRVAAFAYERGHLKDAACLHAVGPSELTAIRAYGLSNPVCVIPNGVDLPTTNTRLRVAPWADRVPSGAKVLLYLGRLHPKKGLPNLVRAWKEVLRSAAPPGASADWILVIAGWNQGSHEQELKRLTSEFEIDDRTLFTGPLFGDARDGAYANADGFILPSFGEGLPLAVLEAWAHGIPVLMTPECNLPEGYAAGAAIRIETDPFQMAAGIMQLFDLPPDVRLNMGLKGRKLVAERFNWKHIATSMHEVYEWLLGLRTKPICVVD